VTSTEQEQEQPKEWASEAIILAASPVFAYLIAFLYEAGFALVFQIPLQFITLSLTTIFIVAGALLFLGLFLFWVGHLILGVIAPADDPIRARMARYTPGILMFVAYRILFPEDVQGTLYLLGAMAILALYEFGTPLITQRGKGTYREKFEAQEKEDEIKRAKTLVHGFKEALGRKGQIIAVVLSIGLPMFYSAGRSAALHQEEFLVVGSSPEMVVLRIYGDNLICAQLNRETRKVERKFVILKAGANSKLMLRLERVGPLGLRHVEGRGA
jgi:hypothetical protein